MKKSTIYLLVLSIIVLISFSCSDGDNVTNNDISNDIVGIWKLQKTKVETMGMPLEVDVSSYNLTVEFNEDGTFSGALASIDGTLTDGEGTYSLNGSTLTTNTDGEITDYDVDLSGSTLALTTSRTVQGFITTMTITMTR
jgi:hypothetical protein